MTHAIPYEPDELDRAAEAAYIVANTHLNGRPPVVAYAQTCAETKEIWRKVAAAVLNEDPADTPAEATIIFSPISGEMLVETWTVQSWRDSYPTCAWLYHPWFGRLRSAEKIGSDPFAFDLVKNWCD